MSKARVKGPLWGTCVVCMANTDTAVQVTGDKQQLVRVLQHLTGDPAKVAKIQVRQMQQGGHLTVKLCADCAGHERGEAKRPRRPPIPVGGVNTNSIPVIGAAQILNPPPAPAPKRARSESDPITRYLGRSLMDLGPGAKANMRAKTEAERMDWMRLRMGDNAERVAAGDPAWVPNDADVPEGSFVLAMNIDLEDGGPPVSMGGLLFDSKERLLAFAERNGLDAEEAPKRWEDIDRDEIVPIDALMGQIKARQRVAMHDQAGGHTQATLVVDLLREHTGLSRHGVYGGTLLDRDIAPKGEKPTGIVVPVFFVEPEPRSGLVVTFRQGRISAIFAGAKGGVARPFGDTAAGLERACRHLERELGYRPMSTASDFFNPERTKDARARRGGPLLADDLARYHHRAWDPQKGWVDLSALKPSDHCVHFDVSNTMGEVMRLEVDGLDEVVVNQGFSDEDRRMVTRNLARHFPNPTPPYGECWLEAVGVPSKGRPLRVGAHIATAALEGSTWKIPNLRMRSAFDWTGDNSDLGPVWLNLLGIIYADEPITGYPTTMAAFGIGLGHDGEIVRCEWALATPSTIPGLGKDAPDEDAIDHPAVYAVAVTMIKAVLFSFSLCNARNIRQQVVREAKLPSRKAGPRKAGVGLVQVREIRIDGTKAPSVERDPTVPTRMLKAHNVRGHWAHYGPKYGTRLLFGRYEASFYRPPSRRGNEALGEVDHRYKVVPWPKEATKRAAKEATP